MTHFELVRTPTFAGAALLRDEDLRRDAERQKDGWAGARVLIVDADSCVPVVWPEPASAHSTQPRLWTRAATELAGSPPPDALLLGEADGVAYWALHGDQAGAGAGPEVRWLNPHAFGGELGALDGTLLAAAVALVRWHGGAGFCTRDGSATRLSNAGWVRTCTASGHEEYPRTDPAVIVLVHDGADRMLLGRHGAWPAGRFSVLAGFVEAGESLESCVAREIAEEVGLDVTDIRYLGSQAWPFPRSLMVGFHAVADPAQPLRLDEDEICEATWVTRDELRHAVARGDWRNEPGSGDASGENGPPLLLLPGRISIARNMIDSWLAAG
ncbi:NAD(+) diphosphatase [Frankia sp. AgKG'84/4]|uniref:NAD(+) diphosphatase n=1 Tax=Frankia sp. AgKG'84/4 TaxID=573490 RepID=UPI00200E919F|nr:NAD(+) diphosphatase [Frankia sp. AgKG'84/4]MCL9796323.1 NAD(+) diphosphatase [Frankia sp. AgKG'84/4]